MRIPAIALLLPLLSAPAAMASGSVATGGGPQRASAAIDLRIDVPKLLEMSLLGAPGSIEVTASDAAAGEVVVSGFRLTVLANDRRGYVVQAELGGPFTEAVIEGLGQPVRVTPEGARVLMPSMVGSARPRPFELAYRLRVRPGTAPGRYPWPVALSIQSP